MEFRKFEKGEIHEESLKAKIAIGDDPSDFVQPWDFETIKKWVLETPRLREWLEQEVLDVNNLREVNYFIRNHAIQLAQAINHMQVHPHIYAVKKANPYPQGRIPFDDSVYTVEPGEEFHCPFCGVRIVEDITGQFIGDTGVIYSVNCPECHKEMSVEVDTETTEQYRGIEGSLKALTAAPDFQMEMQLGDILSPPYVSQISMYITELLGQQSELPISLPEGFSVDILEGDSDYHAENEPIEGFPGSVAVHEWYCSGSFDILDSNANAVGYGDFSVDGLWNSEDGEVVGNSLTILNLRTEENELGIGR